MLKRLILIAAGLVAAELSLSISAAQTASSTSGAAVTWDRILSQPAMWYGSTDATRIADVVVRHQRHTGGWPKNIDMARGFESAELARLAQEASRDDSTIDNGATVTEVRFLARVHASAPDARWREAIVRAVTFLLSAQYPNGGWPQYFPLRSDYSRLITFNDDAMVGVMRLLRDVANGESTLSFFTAATRTRAAAAVARGRELILQTQITVNGRLTGWCQQYDDRTLVPAKARAYEHPSISSLETVSIVRYLMTVADADERVAAAIYGAVAWLRTAELKGMRLEQRPDAAGPAGYDVVVVEDAAARGLWARFYDIGTNRPIYSGRDGVIKYRLADIEIERRAGYNWLGTWAAPLLDREYPAWQSRVSR